MFVTDVRTRMMQPKRTIDPNHSYASHCHWHQLKVRFWPFSLPRTIVVLGTEKRNNRMGMFDRQSPEAVFTPRGDYNPKMYTNRQDLEKDFGEKLRRQEHIVIYGESGCGKSWLYRNFFTAKDVYFILVNLADASRNGSIASELLKVAAGPGAKTVVGYDEKKGSQLGIPGTANGTFEHTDRIAIADEDPLHRAIKHVRKAAGAKPAFIVLDNLERIFSKPGLMEELADLVTLADDPRFLEQKVRFLIVGVPAGVKDFFNKTPSHRTVANRLIELNEVSRLSCEEAKKIVRAGFKRELDYAIQEGFEDRMLDHILWVTDRIPQSVHEYCLELAFICQSEALVDEAKLDAADKKWLKGALNSAYEAVESQLNERDTKVQRRNQVIFALGQLTDNDIKQSQIENEIRRIFYKDDPAAQIGGVPNCLSELTTPEGDAKPLLRRTTKGDAFMFLDPTYRMCIRAMLRLDDQKRIEKMAVDQL